VRVAAEEVAIVGGEAATAQRIVAIGTEHARERFSRIVDFRSYDKRAEAWLSKDMPKDLAAAYLERWRLEVAAAAFGVDNADPAV
jgi:putative DNA primase/helicase